jgi:siroheme synthase (precorrin-2 oxidase/ferrochelatase)
MEYFPILADLRNRECLVVGRGSTRLPRAKRC